MVSVDQHTQVALEIASQGAKLSEELILKILKKLTDLLASDKGKEDFVINDKSNEGKQKLKDLINKHQDGVNTLDDNLTKEQVKDYAKELKKSGIDFSVVKNGKDNYSFYFAGKNAAILEKALKNIVDKKNIVNENKKDLSPVFSIKNVKEIDNKIKEQDKEQGKDKKRDQSLSR